MAKKKVKQQKENSESKIYRFYGINTAVELLRPDACWEWTGGIGFTKWNDPRPQPTKEEVEETMKKIKAFEDSIDTLWRPDQLEKIRSQILQ